MAKKKKKKAFRPRLFWTVPHKLLIVIAVIFALMAGFFYFLNFPTFKKGGPVEFGVTFSPSYQEEFGLDWKDAYIAILDDLGVRRFRLSAYWNATEPSPGLYDFSNLDFQLDEAAKRDAKVLLAVGRKLPRWPECHDPDWLHGSERDDIERHLLEYTEAVVLRYRSHPAVERWQVENEFFFPFGECEEPLLIGSLIKEVDLVRSLSDKPIVITESGEWSAWVPAGLFGDVLGVSMYREAWNGWFGRIYFPIGPGFYQAKAELLKNIKDEFIITELQTEPWGEKPILEMTEDEQFETMNIGKFKDNIEFSKNVGFSEVYLWGVEWWYWLKMNGDSGFWDEGKTLFQ